jgi:hypothetical protein
MQNFDIGTAAIPTSHGLMHRLETDIVDAAVQSNVELLPQTPYLLGLMTRLRDRNASGLEFTRTTDQVARMLLQQGMLIDLFGSHAKTKEL